MVVARWSRPLADLAVNDQLRIRAIDAELSWDRPDGWQCFAPEAFYADGVPVEEISREIDGAPVLGMQVMRSDFYRVSFIHGGAHRTIAHGVTLDHPPGSVHREMVGHWGHPDWQRYAAVLLQRWSRDFADVPYIALWSVLSIHQLFAERTVFDLLSLLRLVADPNHEPWWRQVPGAAYAIQPTDLRYVLRKAKPPGGRHAQPDRDPVLAVTESGTGIWSPASERWLVRPTIYVRQTLNQMISLLVSADWDRRISDSAQ